MIQRIQSLFLLIVGLSFLGHFLWPLATSNISGGKFLADKVFDINDHVVLLGLAILGAALALINIFLFKNRPLQIRLGYILIILGILFPIVGVFSFMNDTAQMSDSAQINDQLGIYLPILTILFAILANRSIKKDESTVRSMDRLR